VRDTDSSLSEYDNFSKQNTMQSADESPEDFLPLLCGLPIAIHFRWLGEKQSN
jgi:hypothetical protein